MKEKHQQTLAGLADVEAGRTISHAQLMAWAWLGLKPVFNSAGPITDGDKA